ncbi:replicative DNA helicase [Methyloceanibacter caenitepidi]|uniref:Replicative DNA helicase n=1 Tax=Methyloceanibacter caenitepidi TaxID=1384459 RepID=A0A0A8K8L8_9HYPH|nr:replicative DNA helicase [Methyloceanibacter caenitepidi]BAQ18334.1 replicative DNA helicase [Methyloceanibacter caenitepidi]
MLREPPHNLEAEQAILGAMLITNDVFYRVSDWLDEEHFYDPGHAELFAAIKRLILNRRRATPISLKTDVAELDFGELKGPAYLGRLAAAAPPPQLAWQDGRVVYDLAQRRRLIEIGEGLIAAAMDAPVETTPDTLVENTETALAAIAEKGKASDHQVTMLEAAADAIDTIAAAYQRDGKMAGQSTGLRDLDSLLGGLAPAQLVILAARPAMGKTALATNIAYETARRFIETKEEDGCPVGFFSCEMSAREVMFRLIGTEIGIPADRLRRGAISPEDFNRILQVSEEKLGPTPLYFDEAGGIKITQLCARARRMKRRHGIGLLVVDYLQLVSGSQRRDGRTQEITEISSQLKALAKELEIPVLALSQLSRECERRDDKRPRLPDLRESGSIEQDADVVMFLYRDEYYIAQAEPTDKNAASYFEWQSDMEKAKAKAEILVPKQRQGPTGSVEVRFDAKLTKFEDLAVQERLTEGVV